MEPNLFSKFQFELYTVEPPKRGQHGDEPFVLSREVVLFLRFLFLSLKTKHSRCLDTYTYNKRDCNQAMNVESCEKAIMPIVVLLC